MIVSAVCAWTMMSCLGEGLKLGLDLPAQLAELSPGPGLGELGERRHLCNWSEFF